MADFSSYLFWESLPYCFFKNHRNQNIRLLSQICHLCLSSPLWISGSYFLASECFLCHHRNRRHLHSPQEVLSFGFPAMESPSLWFLALKSSSLESPVLALLL